MERQRSIFNKLYAKLSAPVFEQKVGIDSRGLGYKPLKAVVVGGLICLAGVAIVFGVSHIAGTVLFIVGWIIVLVGMLIGLASLLHRR